jgi:tetratricopeptide (TPR) repeat protein
MRYLFPEYMDRNSNKKQSLLIPLETRHQKHSTTASGGLPLTGLICLALAITTFAVFYQVGSFEFVNFDDPVYIYDNPNVQGGVNLKAIKWAFTTGHAGNWHPLTWLSHTLDWQLFGPNASGHHLVNLIFHIANTLLLFVVLKQMTRTLWPSAFVAALFALHPLHVESVAWAAERKDVMSTFFWLLAMWAYARYCRTAVPVPKGQAAAKRTPNIKLGATRYLLVVVFFALSLMAKPMAVTLPFVFLLLDYWPLDRLGPATSVKHKKVGTKYSLSYLLIEKIPLFAMVLASGIVTFIVQKKGGAMGPSKGYNFFIRLANASISYLQYIIKMIWPVRLAMFYPHPGRNVSMLYAVISAVFLLTVTILILRFAKGHRYLLTGWFWYLGTLVPVIGLVQVGDQTMADRYSYITLTGLFIIIAWGMPELFGKRPYRKIVLWAASLIVLSALAICAHLQQRYWKDTITLCEHALKVTENNYKAHFSMTARLLEQGRIEEAIRHNTEAIRIRPDYIEAINGLGTALYQAEKTDEAIGYYKRALKINPHVAEANFNLATALATKGRFAEAVTYYRIAIETMDIPGIHSNLGYALLNLGLFEEAAGEYRKVISAMPNDLDTLNKLGYALAHVGEFDEAISLYNKALQIAPDNIEIHLNLGFALTGSGKFAEAAKEYEKILLIQPQNSVAHNDFGVVLFQRGKLDEAIAHFNQAIQINPGYTNARNNLNLVLAEKQKSRPPKQKK